MIRMGTRYQPRYFWVNQTRPDETLINPIASFFKPGPYHSLYYDKVDLCALININTTPHPQDCESLNMIKFYHEECAPT